jgi:polar amino acid transport system substrate-binding protein
MSNFAVPKNKFVAFLLAALSLVVVFHGAVRADHKLIINNAAQAPWANPEHTGFNDEIIKEVFRRIGHDLEISFMTANARALANVNEGIDDGNMLRIEGMEKLFPNVRIVPEPVIYFEFVGFTKNPKIIIKEWADLEPYNVAYIRGWKIVESNVKKTQSLNIVKNADQLFDLLRNDRTDIIIFERIRGRYILDTEEIKGVRALEPPLSSSSFYLYLHKKHVEIIPSIVAALKEMKADGTYRQIFESTVGSFISVDEAKRMMSK